MATENFSGVAVKPKGKPRGAPFKKGVSGNPAGKPIGTKNTLTADLKEAILLAAAEAGGEGGTVAYLRSRAIDTPGPFLALLGKVLPMTLANADGQGFIVEIIGRAAHKTTP